MPEFSADVKMRQDDCQVLGGQLGLLSWFQRLTLSQEYLSSNLKQAGFQHCKVDWGHEDQVTYGRFEWVVS